MSPPKTTTNRRNHSSAEDGITTVQMPTHCAMRYCTRPVAVDDPAFCGPPCRAYGAELKRDLENDIIRARNVIGRTEPELASLTDAFNREVTP